MNRLLKPSFATFSLFLSTHVLAAGTPEITPLEVVDEQRVALIELTQGFSVKGLILRERPEDLILDLGFAVLRIPKDYVLEIREAEERQSTNDRSSDLYRVSDRPYIRPVKELASELGGGVVRVRTTTGLGSGFIIDPRGYVVTNNHVIAGEHEISIVVYDQQGRDLEKKQFHNVRIVATDEFRDLALLKIEDAGEFKFITVPVGESGSLRPGQRVFAIGSPLGLDRSVTEGIISLRNRLLSGQLYIQQTAEISPGNSGGPLFNLRGEVVGINNMKVVAAGAEGLAFAIPTTTLKMFLLNREAYAFDPQNPNAGFRYYAPPTAHPVQVDADVETTTE